MPPAPNGARTSYAPSFAPGPSDINSPGDVRSIANAAWAGLTHPHARAASHSLLPRCYHLLPARAGLISGSRPRAPPCRESDLGLPIPGASASQTWGALAPATLPLFVTVNVAVIVSPPLTFRSPSKRVEPWLKAYGGAQ